MLVAFYQFLMLEKNGCKKSAKGEGFYGKTLGLKCVKLLSHKENNLYAVN